MPTTFIKGDFLAETPRIDGARVFAFPAEVSGSMEAGVAVAVKKRWPALAEWWRQTARGQPGDAKKWSEGADVVYALAIERSGSRAKLSWLERAVQSMVADAAKSGVKRISLARPWGGASGLDGSRAKSVLQQIGDASEVDLVVFEQFIRAKVEEPPPEEEPALPPPDEEEEEPNAKPKKKASSKAKAKAKASPKKAKASPKKVKAKAKAKAKASPKKAKAKATE
jgi:hypothetical protein